MSEKIEIYEIPFYTDDVLKEKFRLLLKQKGGPMTKELLVSFVDSNHLVPIINNKPGIIRRFIMKLRNEKPDTPFFGIAMRGIAYVIFDRQITKDTEIVETALHELVHVSAMRNQKAFIRINDSFYERFYSYYYKELFEAKGYDKKYLTDFINQLNTKRWSNDTYDRILYSAFRDYSELPEESFESRIFLVKRIINTFLRNSSRYPYYNHALALIRKTYRKLFKNMDYTAGVGQELFAPDEIIAILSTINPSHPNVVKSLKLLQKK
jgi:hypothetical protein